MKKNFICFLKVCISGAIALVILSLFSLLYDYTGCHVQNMNGDTDYKWRNNQYSSTMKEGLSWFRFDKNGFNNIDDTSFEERPVDILLMGSSHMEARQIKKNENVGALLNEYIPDLRTYNIGISGHNIYTCVKNIQAACNVYAPLQYVVLETDNIMLEERSLQQVINGEYSEIPSYDLGFLYFVQKNIPAVKSLYKSLSEWKDISAWRTVEYIDKTEIGELEKDTITDELKEEIDKFLLFAVSSIPDRCKLIIFYHPSVGINERGEFVNDDNLQYVTLFANACRENDIIFVNGMEDFVNLYENRSILAKGFINTAVGTGHLNRYGHQVIAYHLSEVIRKDLEDRR